MSGGGLGTVIGTVGGGIVGSIIPGAGTMAGAAIGAQIGGAIDGSNANNAAADAQERAARAQQEGYANQSQRVVNAAQATPQEIAQLEQANKTNADDLARKQKMLDSVDPALLEVGKQALQLAQGKEAASLDPLRRQRAQDRNVLMDRLTKQLGPGAETSSVGQAALQRFDQATADQLNSAQQQTLGSFLDRSQGIYNNNNVQSNIQNSRSIGNDYSNIQNRIVNATSGTNPYAANGAQYAADITRAKGQGQFAGQIAGAIGGLSGSPSNFGSIIGGGSSSGGSSGSGYLGTNTSLNDLFKS